jgi:hypothetical protein
VRESVREAVGEAVDRVRDIDVDPITKWWRKNLVEAALRESRVSSREWLRSRAEWSLRELRLDRRIDPVA